MNEFLVVGVLLGLVLLRAVLVGALALLVIHPVRACPACFREPTFRVRKWWLRLLARRMEWRWCPGCGWEGPARRMAGGASPYASSTREGRWEAGE
jgi:hypothetical protein